jgi:hypothetical protein
MTPDKILLVWLFNEPENLTRTIKYICLSHSLQVCSYAFDKFVMLYTATLPVPTIKPCIPWLFTCSLIYLYLDTRKTHKILYLDLQKVRHGLFCTGTNFRSRLWRGTMKQPVLRRPTQTHFIAGRSGCIITWSYANLTFIIFLILVYYKLSFY